jgi:hypothetical protein
MAKSKDNVVMQGASGRVGKNLVFRQKGDQTIIAKRPRIAEGKVVTAKQKAVQDKFYDASRYAKRAIADPVLKEAYAAKATINQTAYNVAFRDYFSAPEIRRCDDRGYKGQAGDSLTFLIRDIMKVTELSVEILGQDDTVVETGLAQSADPENIEWTYVTTVANGDYSNAKYRLTMLDTPKNVTVVTKSYGEDTML